MEDRANLSDKMSNGDWEYQAMEHGWLPPEYQNSRKPPKEHNRMLLIMVVGVLVVLFMGANSPKTRDQQSEGTTSTVETRSTPIP